MRNPRTRGLGGSGRLRLAASLRAGMVVGGRGQFGNAAVGAASVPGNGAAGAPTQGYGLYRSRVRLVSMWPV